MADDESEWRTPSHVGRKQRNKEKLQEKWDLRLQTDPELIAAVELKKKKKKKEAKEVAKKEKKEQKEQKLKGAPIPDEATGAGWSREQLDNLLNKQKAPTKSKGKNKAKKPVAAAASSAASSSSRSQREDPTPAEQAQVPSDRIAEAFRSISGSPSLVSLRVLADSLEQLFGQQYNIALQRTDLTVLQGLPEEFVDPALEWLARVSEDDVARLLVSLVIPLSNKFSEDGKATSGSTGRGYQIFVQLVLRSVHAQRIFHDNAILAGGLPQSSKDPFFGWLHATLWQLQPRAAMFLAFQRNLATPPERQAELQRQVSREQDPTFITAYLKYAKNPDNVELNPKNFVLLLDFCASEDEKFRSSVVGALSSFLVSPETTYDDVAEVFEQLYQLRGSRLPNINNLFIALTDQLDQELPAPVVDRLREQFARFDFTNVRSFANHWSHLQNESLPIDNFILVVQQIQTNLQSLAAHIERITRRKLVFASISLVLLAALVFYLLIKRNLLPASFLKHFQQ